MNEYCLAIGEYFVINYKTTINGNTIYNFAVNTLYLFPLRYETWT